MEWNTQSYESMNHELCDFCDSSYQVFAFEIISAHYKYEI